MVQVEGPERQSGRLTREDQMYTIVGMLVFVVAIAAWMVLPTRIPRDK